jgi:hypothetical protein
MSSLKEKHLLWFCGFYEGEGSVSNDKSNNNRLRLSISQNDKTPLELAKTIWGGHITERSRKSPASDKQCLGYEWRICHNQALVFINDIKPHMLIPYKINQIEVCLAGAVEGFKSRYKCTDCDMHYASPSGRRRHWKSTHSNTNASDSNTELRDNQIAGNPL